jgi:hypothetical protein
VGRILYTKNVSRALSPLCSVLVRNNGFGGDRTPQRFRALNLDVLPQLQNLLDDLAKLIPSEGIRGEELEQDYQVWRDLVTYFKKSVQEL